MNVGTITTPLSLLWFVNSGSGGGGRPKGGRQAHGSRDVPISPDEVGSRKGSIGKENEVSKGGKAEGRSHDALNVPLDPSQPF